MANDGGPEPYVPLMLLFLVLGLGLGLPFCLSFEAASIVEEFQQSLKLGIIAMPLLLLLLLVFCSNASAWSNGILHGSSDPSSIHKLGGSPWGLALFLLLILLMIWYQCNILEYWNPLNRI
jgi:hypothetical protein